MVWIAAAASAAAPQYQIFDIGIIQAGDTASQGFGASPGGVAVGRSVRSNASQAFRWTVGGGLVGLPNLAGRNHAVANDANDYGIAVGTAATTLFGSGRLPVIWNEGVVSQLQLPAGETIGDVNGVNALAVAVGSVDAGSFQQAVIYNYSGPQGNVITGTTATGCTLVTAFGINDSGRIVGQGIDPNNAARNVGIVYDLGHAPFSEVGALPGANGAIAFGVSNGGHVVGSSMMNQGPGMPFIWLPATGIVAIPLATGTSEGSARAVNSAGWVVGQDSSAFSMPFLWDGTTTYRLADLLPPGSGWDLEMNTSSSALGISDNGTIVGTGVHNGETHAYAMVPVQATPTPTPGPVTHFIVSAPMGAVFNQPFNFTVSARDAAENIAPGYAGTVHYTSTDSQATLPPDGPLINGTGTRSAIRRMGGGQTITATDTANPSITGTSSPIFVIIIDPTATPSPTVSPSPTPSPTPTATPSPGPATHFKVQAPNLVLPGTPFNFVVTAQDDANNTAPSYTGVVHFTSTDPSATLSGDSTLPNGTGTFHATHNQTGRTITATDTVNGSITGTSDPIFFYPSPTPTPTPTATPPPTPSPGPQSDIGISISDSPDPVLVGQNLTYTISVGNAGPSYPIPVTMTDNLPASVNFVSVTPSQGSCTGTNQIICNLGALGSATVTLVVTPTQGGPLSNTASAYGNANDPFPYNNNFTASTTVYSSPTPIPTKAVNLSTRMRIQTGNNVGIGGFILSGNVPKNVALRGIGPSLGAFGIADALADPTLELRDSNGGLIKLSDDWTDNAADAAQLTLLGLAPSNAKESGIVATLQPGTSYTAILAGKNQTTGVGLVEIYDVNQAADSKLANISTRSLVLTGNDVTIAGFILGGEDNTYPRIVVRGLGPSLAQFGLSPVLADPTLELHNSNGTLVVSNNDWTTLIMSSQLVALGLAPQNPKESAIVEFLWPGAFTAILAGANGGTGIGLIEIYSLP